MSLYLFEIVPAASDRASARALIAAVDEAASSVSAAVLESQVTSGHGRVFTVVEHDGEHDDETRYDLSREVAESHEQKSVV